MRSGWQPTKKSGVRTKSGSSKELVMSMRRNIITGVLACIICAASVSSSVGATASQVTFLSKTQAAAAIVDDALEPYFGQLQPMEMSAKTGAFIEGATISEQRALCRKRYQAGVLGFTKAEEAAIRFYLDKVEPVLSKEYPRIGATPWSFIKVSQTIEGGLPHTRGRYIVLSESICKQLVMMQELPPDHMAHLGIVELLVHEQMHVVQRLNPGCCDPLYRDLWGFQKADSITGCKWLVEHQLVNPDAVDCRWVLPVKKGAVTKYLWPLVVFSEGARLKKMPADFAMLAILVAKKDKGFAVETDGDGKPIFSDLEDTPEFSELFPLSQNTYHPHEASADMFAKMLIFDSFIPQDAIPPDARSEVDKELAPLREWFKKNAGKPVSKAGTK